MAEFKEFLLKTNALALAVGVIIGAALGTVVTSLVKDIIMPPISLLLGGVDFAAAKIVLKAAPDGADPATEIAIRWGNLLNAIIIFVVVALVVFYIGKVFLKPAPEAPAAPSKACPFCKESNAVDASKCKFCASAI